MRRSPLKKDFQGAKRMEHTAKGLRKKLLSLVKKLGKNPEAYANRPGKDFTHHRALDFEKSYFFCSLWAVKAWVRV